MQKINNAAILQNRLIPYLVVIMLTISSLEIVVTLTYEYVWWMSFFHVVKELQLYFEIQFITLLSY